MLSEAFPAPLAGYGANRCEFISVSYETLVIIRVHHDVNLVVIAVEDARSSPPATEHHRHRDAEWNRRIVLFSLDFRAASAAEWSTVMLSRKTQDQGN